jgi:hypothetical protein
VTADEPFEPRAERPEEWPVRPETAGRFENERSHMPPEAAEPPVAAPSAASEEAVVRATQTEFAENAEAPDPAPVSRTLHQNVRDADGTTVIGFHEGPLQINHPREALRSSKLPVNGPEDDGASLFVYPEGLDTIERELSLRTRQVVVLAAEDGGHRFASRILAAAVAGLTPRRIHPGADLRIEPWQLATHPRSAWLLDLTDTEVEDRKLLIEHFSGLSDDLREQRSTLIVVFAASDLSESETRSFGVERLPRPDPYEVLRNHLADRLATAGVVVTAEFIADWVAFAAGRKLLEQKPPAEAVRLCEAVAYAVKDLWSGLIDLDRASFEELFGQHRVEVEALALDRFQAWETELDKWNAARQNEPRLRAFQLAAAVLPSGDPIRIRTEATRFLSSISAGQIQDQALAGPGTRQLSRDAGAELKEGKVVFTKPGFAEAVVRYFWDDWPEYRAKFLDWLMRLSTAKEIEPGDRAQVKELIGGSALRHAVERGEFDFLYKVIAAWAGSQPTLDDAANLLEAAATTSGISRQVRDRTLQWVSSETADRGLKLAVAKLCASPTFAPTHARLVVKRLSHLMKEPTGDEAGSVLESVLQEACQLLVTEAHQSSAVLEWIGTGMASENPALRDRTAKLFLLVARAHVEDAAAPALIGQAETSAAVHEALVPAWGGVLRTLAVEEIQPAFTDWMDAAGEPETETHVLSLFRDAVAFDKFEAGEANQKGAQLSFGWKAASKLPADRVDELDRRLLAALRDGAAAAAHWVRVIRQQERE